MLRDFRCVTGDRHNEERRGGEVRRGGEEGGEGEVEEEEAGEGTPLATPIKTPGRFLRQGTSSITPLGASPIGASPIPTTPLDASSTTPQGETPYGSDTHTSGDDGGGQLTSGCGDRSDRNDGGGNTRVMVKRLVSGHFFGGEEEREEHVSYQLAITYRYHLYLCMCVCVRGFRNEIYAC